MKIIGIDFSPNTKKPTGMVKMIGRDIYFFSTFRDVIVKKEIEQFNPKLIVVSSPLSGTTKKLRDADKELKKRGYKVQYLDTDYMKKIISRTRNIKNKMKNYKFIETNVSASGQILTLDKSDALKFIRKMKKIGFREINKPKNIREMNAGIAAMVGYLNIIGMTEALGKRAKVIIPIIK